MLDEIVLSFFPHPSGLFGRIEIHAMRGRKQDHEKPPSPAIIAAGRFPRVSGFYLFLSPTDVEEQDRIMRRPDRTNAIALASGIAAQPATA